MFLYSKRKLVKQTLVVLSIQSTSYLVYSINFYTKLIP